MVNHKPVVVPVDAGLEDDTGATEENSQPISRLLSLHFSPSIDQEITVTRTTEGTFYAELAKKELQAHHHRAGATIDSSLYLAAMQAGIPADVVVDMIRMFSYKVDFQRDLHPGDRFEVYYDYYYTPDGTPAKYGAISYAMMTLGGKDIPMYRFQPNASEPAEYFDSKGESAKGLLMKTPVDGARISSGFGSRFHPILGYTRMHKGVDFAVPTGTPVMAAGAGTIQFMGRASGYGNFVKISHGNGYSTDYGHLSRFAPGMRTGARVRQGQVFAYSGMTGMATGPHLHYEILVNGVQVNPLTVKMAQGRKLIGNLLRAFLGKRLEIDTMVASTALEAKVADNATDLRPVTRRQAACQVAKRSAMSGELLPHCVSDGDAFVLKAVTTSHSTARRRRRCFCRCICARNCARGWKTPEDRLDPAVRFAPIPMISAIFAPGWWRPWAS